MDFCQRPLESLAQVAVLVDNLVLPGPEIRVCLLTSHEVPTGMHLSVSRILGRLCRAPSRARQRLATWNSAAYNVSLLRASGRPFETLPVAVEFAEVPQCALTLGLAPLVGTAVGMLVQAVEAASAGVPPFAALPVATEARPPHAGGNLFIRI